MAEEVKEAKKDKFQTHHLIDWALLVAVLVVILAGAGYYLFTVVDDTSTSLSDTYRQDVVTSPTTQELKFVSTKDKDVTTIDQTMNQVNPDDFAENSLSDSLIGL